MDCPKLSWQINLPMITSRNPSSPTQVSPYTDITAGLWKQKTRPIVFGLVVNDFAVKHTNKDDVDHLLSTVEELCVCSMTPHNTVASTFNGITTKALAKSQCLLDMLNTLCPVALNVLPMVPIHNMLHPKPSPSLDAADSKHVQEALGTFLFYAQAADSTMHVTLSTLAPQQS